MAEQQNTEQKTAPAAEVEKKEKVSIGKAFQDVMKHKRLFFKVLPVVFVLAAIYTLSKPNYYSCQVMLAPEIANSGSSRGSLASLASTFGMNLGAAATVSNDAIRPDLYPDLMNSVAFLTSLFDIPVHRIDEDSVKTYYDYLLNDQKSTWWSKGIQALFTLIFGKGDDTNVHRDVNTFKLTKKQTLVASMIGKRVLCDVDKKTLVITIQVTDQDPLIAATIADSVQYKLRKFITEYRTSKARIDLDHYVALEQLAKQKYEAALNAYATFSDHNQKVFLERVRSEQTKLENEFQLQQRNYMQVAQQRQLAEAKLQEDTPAFTVLQPATVPLKKSGPARAKTCLVYLFLAFMGTVVWILHKEGDLMPLLGMGGDDDDE